MDSYIFVVEQEIASLEPLHKIMEAYHARGTTPDNTTICPIGTEGHVAIREQYTDRVRRKFWTLDGGHRLAAQTQLLAEAKRENRLEDVKRFSSMQAIVLHGMSPTHMSCLASRLNAGNESDIVKTTKLHQYTSIRKQVQFYEEDQRKILEAAVEAAVKEDNAGQIEAAKNALAKFETSGIIIQHFCEAINDELEAFGQSIKSTYMVNVKYFSLCVAVSMGMEEQVAAKLQVMYDDEVSVCFSNTILISEATFCQVPKI